MDYQTYVPPVPLSPINSGLLSIMYAFMLYECMHVYMYIRMYYVVIKYLTNRSVQTCMYWASVNSLVTSQEVCFGNKMLQTY